MPRLPKPAPLRQNHERRDVGLVALDGGLTTTPEPSAGWLAVTKAEWRTLWSSPLTQCFLPATDEPVLRRLYGMRDERERMVRVVKRMRLVQGSRGQPRANPLQASIMAYESAIVALEDRMGISARSRLQLGIQLGEAVRSLADLNRMAADDTDAEAADLLLAYSDPPAPEPRATGGQMDGVVPRPRSRRRTG